MEIIPQRVYCYDDGVPAFKSGEWEGIRPSKWKGSKLILKPIERNPIYLERSIRHFPHVNSSEFIFRPHMKQVHRVQHRENSNPSKRVIEPHYTELPNYIRNIKLRPHIKINNDDNLCVPFAKMKRHIELNVDKSETTIENKMTRKRKIVTIDNMRNGIKMNNPGDKIYNCVENCPGYFKMEGIIPGSTNNLRYRKTVPKKAEDFYETLDLKVKSLSPEKLWNYKAMREKFEKDEGYVKELGEWERNNLDIYDTHQNKNKK